MGISTSYNILKKPHYNIDLGFSSIRYKGLSYNFATFDMKMQFKGLTIQIYGNIPVNTSPFHPIR